MAWRHWETGTLQQIAQGAGPLRSVPIGAIDLIERSGMANAKLLALPPTQPILLAESVNVDQQGNIIKYGVARLRGNRMELFFENNAE